MPIPPTTSASKNKFAKEGGIAGEGDMGLSFEALEVEEAEEEGRGGMLREQPLREPASP